jgi:pimeloyl-ACP methyl ester carboxylesterase
MEPAQTTPTLTGAPMAPTPAPRPPATPPASMRLFGAAVRAIDAIAPERAADLAARSHLRVRSLPLRAQERAALEAASHTALDFGGRKLAVYQWGEEGPVTLLVHGWNGRAGQMTPLVESLRALGHRVVSYDAPAHGRSDGTHSHVIEMAEALGAVAASVGNVRAIVAHSMGATAAALAMARGLQVERLAMITPSPSPAPWVERTADVLGLAGHLRERFVARIEHHCGAPIRCAELGAVASFLEAPVLAVLDRKDRIAPVRESRPAVARIPRHHILETEGLGHYRALRDATVIAAVGGFVGNAPGGHARSHGRATPSSDLRDPWLQAQVERLALAF